MDKTRQRQLFSSPVSNRSFAIKAQDKCLFQRSCLHVYVHVYVEALDVEMEKWKTATKN